MAAQPLRQKVYVRTHPRALLARNRLMTELEADPRLDFGGGPLTQEAFANATWLWLEAMGAAAVAEAIAPHVARLQALVTGAVDTHEGHAVVPVHMDGDAAGPNPANGNSPADRPVRRKAR